MIDSGLSLQHLDQLAIYVDIRDIMYNQLEIVFLLQWKYGLIDDNALVVHTDGVALEVTIVADIGGHGEVIQKMSFETEIDLRDGDGWNWLRNWFQSFVEVLLHHLCQFLELVMRSPLLIYHCSVIVGSNMWLKDSILVLIGSRGECKVGAAVYHIQTEGVMIVQQSLHIIPEIVSGQSLPLFAPMGQPTCVHLATKDQSFLEVLRSNQFLVFVEMVAFAEAYVRPRPVMLHPVRVCVLVVKVANHPQSFPHCFQVVGVCVVLVETAEFVLDLQQYDVATV